MGEGEWGGFLAAALDGAKSVDGLLSLATKIAGLTALVWAFIGRRRIARSLRRRWTTLTGWASGSELLDEAFPRVQEAINERFEGRASIWGLRLDGMPEVNRVADHSDAGALRRIGWPDPGAVVAAAKYVQAEDDATHGLAANELWRDRGESSIDFISTRYKVVNAARAMGLTPPVISAGGIVFCRSDAAIVLQTRTDHVDTYKGCLYILGGNYEPAGRQHRYDDAGRPALRRTAIREIGEEAGIALTDIGSPPVLVGEEIDTGFIQYVYAGIEISNLLGASIDGSDEGKVRLFTLEEIERIVVDGTYQGVARKFVPSGLMMIMAWLGLGAPNQHGERPIRSEALRRYEAMLPHARNAFGIR